MQAANPKTQLEIALDGGGSDLDQKSEVNLKQLWEEAKHRFERKTGTKIEGPEFDRRISDEVRRICWTEDDEEDRGQEEANNRTTKDYIKRMFKKAKEIFKGVFIVIWKFSDFFMPAATSIPFIGSGVTLMVKAIELLIVTTKDYREIFTKAAELFEQVGFFSMRFDILLEAEKKGAEVHPKFRQFLNVVIAHIIDCVALYISITNEAKGEVPQARGFKAKLHRAKENIKNVTDVTTQFFKTMGGDDRGVSQHLSRLRSLIEEENKLASSLVLATVLQIHTNVIAVRGGVETITSQLHTMRDMIGPSKIDQLRKLLHIDKEPWKSRLRICAERRISGTGDWFIQHNLMTSWVSNTARSDQILAIEAASRSGKTYLATAAITHLRKPTIQAGTPVAVAYYLFDRTAKQLTAGDVVRAIAYQLCVQDQRFFEIAFPVIQEVSDSAMSSEQLWDTLVLNVVSTIAQASPFTCFIILDGLDLVDEQELTPLRKLLVNSSTANPTLRFLLTGNDICLSTITGHGHLPVARLSLRCAYPNSRDFALVTDAYLANCVLFSKTTGGGEFLQYKTIVCEQIVQKVSGDYYLLHSCISDMRHAMLQSEVEQIIERAHERRQETIQRNLLGLAERLSELELKQLRVSLHLLAVLDRLGMPMPHLSVVQRYITQDRDTCTMTKATITSAYSNLIMMDDRGYISFATEEITNYILVDSSNTVVTQMLRQSSRNGQLKAIQQFLNATFTQEALHAHGFNDQFFQAKYLRSNLSQFIVDGDTAMAKVVAQLIDSLSKAEQISHREGDLSSTVSILARKVLSAVLLRPDISDLDGIVKSDLGSSFARLFLTEDLLAVFLPPEDMKQTTATWGKDMRYFEAAFNLIKYAGITTNRERDEQRDFPQNLEDINSANDLKIIVSQMIAKRWLQSKSFWTYAEIHEMFGWFTTVPELGLEEKDVYDRNYDFQRTKGWFTPSNWNNIRRWAQTNIEVWNQAEFDIQTGAMLCALGNRTYKAINLLDPLIESDWRAAVWYAEARSMEDDEGYEFVGRSLELMLIQKPDHESMSKAIDEMFRWTGHWNDVARDHWVRQKAFELNNSVPGLLSYETISISLEIAIRAKGIDEGFQFFRSFYGSNKDLLYNTLVRQAGNNVMNVALSRIVANDADGSRMYYLYDVYRNSMALCETVASLSQQEKRITKFKLGFWLGRLDFLHPTKSALHEAIRVWESLIKDFTLKPTVADVEIMLPIITHLCSAYLRESLADSQSSEASSIKAKVEKLIESTSVLQDPLALKLRFRMTLCLARIHVARGNTEDAHETLREYAKCAFIMISQRNNKPLSSVGWLYLASILTTLGEDSAWAWSRVRLHQRDRWASFRGYEKAQNLTQYPSNPPLDEVMSSKLEAIKRGEEFAFWDGSHPNFITSSFPDDLYLPSYASMACDGRQCWSTSEDPNRAAQTHCEPLQIPAQYDVVNGTFPPAQAECDENDQWPRKSFWVCRDCVSVKLCITCYESLKQDTLPPMGCQKSHSGVFVEGSAPGEEAYEASDDYMRKVETLKQSWET